MSANRSDLRSCALLEQLDRNPYDNSKSGNTFFQAVLVDAAPPGN